jgi:hypothetical protein
MTDQRPTVGRVGGPRTSIHAAERLQQMAIAGGGSAAEELREARSSNRDLKNWQGPRRCRASIRESNDA